MYQLKFEQKIPQSLDTVWDFMSSPTNLKRITPDYMGFDITNEIGPEDKMYPGMIISYQVSPVLGIKIKWVTEITHVIDKTFFVDEQRIGPYNLWHHQHHMKEITGGVLMSDILSYNPPFGLLGKLANGLFVKNKILEIFDYRYKAVEDIFGEM